MSSFCPLGLFHAGPRYSNRNQICLAAESPSIIRHVVPVFLSVLQFVAVDNVVGPIAQRIGKITAP